jgi:DNA-binding transcriptional LysR family regulator
MPSPAMSWLGVEPRHLSALRAVADHRSFRAAADALGYSQSAMSQLVSQLERMLGVPLVQRQPVALTAQGELLLSHATAILHSFAAAQADLAALGAPRVRVGVLAELAPTLLAVAPELLEVECNEELASLVATGRVELAVGERPAARGPFAVRPIHREPYVLAVPAAWALDPADPFEDLALLARPESPPTAQLTRQLHARGIVPRWTARAPSDAAAVALARAGIGAAVVPSSAVEPWDELVTAVPLDDLLPARTICSYVHRDRRLPGPVTMIADAVAVAFDARDHRFAPVRLSHA